jgi:4-hydroxy-3-methylbut-2-enyl diphosphate reductase
MTSNSGVPSDPLSGNGPRRVLLAKPRGYGAGVDRAVQTVELALEKYGAPIYVRKQIVHNVHVVKTL